MGRHHRTVVVALLVVCAAIAACTTPPALPGSPGASESTARRSLRASSAPHVAAVSELTETERKYGVAPERSDRVVYQPEVVIVEGGADIIRGASENGLQWTIDAVAPHASELQPGKIMFVTGRAVGRVLAVQRQDATLVLTLGPVDITEVIRDCDIEVNQPIDFAQAIAYTSNDLPGAVAPVDPISAEPPRPQARGFDGAGYQFVSRGPGPQALLYRVAMQTTSHRFQVSPTVNLNGIGVRLTSDAGGVRLATEAALRLSAPRLRFVLKMSGAKVQQADLQLDGAAGLLLSFEAASEVGLRGNINERIQVPTDFSLPILGLPVPIAVTVRQAFIVKTAFSSKGALRAKGEYTFAGNFTVGYHNGTFGVGGPTGFTVKDSMLQSIEGVSLGVTGLVIAHQAKVIAGIGAFGFATGPYLAMNSSVGVSRHSDLDTLLRCRSATLTIGMRAGIGYVMPLVVTKAINSFLRLLNIGEIKGEGGLESAPMTIINSTSTAPNIRGCTV